ncbi:MAG: 30S ribosomal protein S6 [Bacteroidota bacterium]|nr:30S ribosomal protein S6 [Bacteroidota bacterium]MDP4191077.1 30S ribosomal protein S6 [Bacteroidota bacterium]MDP4196240.1 30S ribosomal protein S6 [Bacteroidota bacterium]
MLKKNYESAVIINAAIEEEQIEATINRIAELIRVNGGEIVDIDKWGRKRLAYTVEKTKSGYYVIFRFVAPTDLIAKLERMYQLDEFILRHIIIVLDKFALEYMEKAKTQRAQEKPEENAVANAAANTADATLPSNEEKTENEA